MFGFVWVENQMEILRCIYNGLMRLLAQRDMMMIQFLYVYMNVIASNYSVIDLGIKRETVGLYLTFDQEVHPISVSAETSSIHLK